MTKFEEFLAGLSFFLVTIGGLGMVGAARHPGDMLYLLKPMSILMSGHVLFSLVKIKLILRSKT